MIDSRSSLQCSTCEATMDPRDRQYHPTTRVPQCSYCHANYIQVGDLSQYRGGVERDGVDNYCRSCFDGGELILCQDTRCRSGFCRDCVRRILGDKKLNAIQNNEDWYCMVCDYTQVEPITMKLIPPKSEHDYAKKGPDLKRKPPVSFKIFSTSAIFSKPRGKDYSTKEVTIEETTNDHQVSTTEATSADQVTTEETIKDNQVMTKESTRDDQVITKETTEDHRLATKAVSRDDQVTTKETTEDHLVTKKAVSRDDPVTTKETTEDHLVTKKAVSRDDPVTTKETTKNLQGTTKETSRDHHLTARDFDIEALEKELDMSDNGSEPATNIDEQETAESSANINMADIEMQDLEIVEALEAHTSKIVEVSKTLGWALKDVNLLKDRLDANLKAILSTREDFDETRFRENPDSIFSWVSNLETFLAQHKTIELQCRRIYEYMPHLKKK